MDIQKQRNGCNVRKSFKLSNGYILPEGKMTPNTLFVGGIDTKVEENEIRDFFARFGPVKEVKIITYRGGICKGFSFDLPLARYGFVYFNEDVDIQTIVEQQISFKGKKLKLGPAIMKERSLRPMPSHWSLGPAHWMSPSQYTYCPYCPQMGDMYSPVLNGGSPCMQPYSYPSPPALMVPQMPLSYSQSAYTYQYPAPHWAGEQRTRLVNQNFVDSGVQTLLTLV